MYTLVEADWKRFQAMVISLRERYLAEQNTRLTRILNDPQKTETERFWTAHELVESEAKTLRRCLDGHSRSSMVHFLITMRGAGMIQLQDMDGFSESLRTSLFGDLLTKEP